MMAGGLEKGKGTGELRGGEGMSCTREVRAGGRRRKGGAVGANALGMEKGRAS